MTAIRTHAFTELQWVELIPTPASTQPNLVTARDDRDFPAIKVEGRYFGRKFVAVLNVRRAFVRDEKTIVVALKAEAERRWS